jgi:hypothetical protein
MNNIKPLIQRLSELQARQADVSDAATIAAAVCMLDELFTSWQTQNDSANYHRDAVNRLAASVDAMGERSETVVSVAQERICNLEREVHHYEDALRRIVRPSDCGCWPCRGDCRSATALQIEIDGIKDLAKRALGIF